MRTFQLSPLPVLRPFIDRLWGWEGEAGEVVTLPTVLPGTGAELYFHYGEPFAWEDAAGAFRRADAGHLFCQRRRTFQLAPASGLGFVAVRFRIGMIHRFTAVPARELHDGSHSVADLWGAEGRALLGCLSYAKNHDERLALIQHFLVDRLCGDARDAAVEAGMALLYRQAGELPVDTLADRLRLGRRRLERRFLALTGQTPGEVKGLCRFQHVVRDLVLETAARPAGVAAARGYYDQAHFNRDFRARVGCAPGEYLRRVRTGTHFYNTQI
ncbi:MAG: AraC family transcriptional regulator [Proteobacteria bacterium]|nr:AraC family transcriptional regulator [Pseudomonadota bacterium]